MQKWEKGFNPSKGPKRPLIDYNTDNASERRRRKIATALTGILLGIAAVWFLTPAPIMVEQNSQAAFTIGLLFSSGVALFALALRLRHRTLGVYSALVAFVSAGVFATWAYFATRPSEWETLWTGMVERLGPYILIGALLSTYLFGDKKK